MTNTLLVNGLLAGALTWLTLWVICTLVAVTFNKGRFFHSLLVTILPGLLTVLAMFLLYYLHEEYNLKFPGDHELNLTRWLHDSEGAPLVLKSWFGFLSCLMMCFVLWASWHILKVAPTLSLIQAFTVSLLVTVVGTAVMYYLHVHGQWHSLHLWLAGQLFPGGN